MANQSGYVTATDGAAPSDSSGADESPTGGGVLVGQPRRDAGEAPAVTRRRLACPAAITLVKPAQQRSKSPIPASRLWEVA